MAFVGGIATAWPLMALAQQSAVPVIGFLNNQSPDRWQKLLAGFRKGLGEGGFVEGQTVRIEYRWAEGSNDRLAGLAADLVGRKVDIIVATGGSDPVVAAKTATATIPIVFSVGGDPVKLGFVDSLARPGGNATGFTLFTNLLGPKRFEILRELVLGNAPIGMLINPDNASAGDQVREIEAVATSHGERLIVVRARGEHEIETAFEALVASRVRALFVGSEAQYFARAPLLASLSARHTMPTIYEARPFVEAGGLISYGVDFAEVYRQVGRYVARILNGAKPAELPVEQPTRFELVINAKTAKAFGLEIPLLLLARADEVIE